MRKISSSLAILAFTAFSAPSWADTPDWAKNVYIFGTAGKSYLDKGPLPSEFSTDETDTTYSLGVGYTLHENLSLEAGYADLGEMSFKAQGNSESAKLAYKGYIIGIKGEVMVADKISLLARTGAIIWKEKVKGTEDENGKLKDGTDPYISIGAAYHFTNQFAVDLQASRYYFDDASYSDEADTLTLGLTYRF